MYTLKWIGYKITSLLLVVCWLLMSLFLFTLLDYLESFWNFINGQHAKMSFTIDNEKQNRMSFRDVHIIFENKTFTTSAHSKSTFSRVFAHFDSSLPPMYIFGTVNTHTYRYFKICSGWKKLWTESYFLKQFFFKNVYFENFTNKSFKRFTDNIHVVKETTLSVEKKSFVLVIPYLSSISLQTRTK